MDLIELVAAVYGIIKEQASADAEFFLKEMGSSLYEENRVLVKDTMLAAYRWQYIDSSLEETRFPQILSELLSETQIQEISQALQSLQS